MGWINLKIRSVLGAYNLIRGRRHNSNCETMAHGVVDSAKNTTIMISREARAYLHTIQHPRETLGNVIDRLIKKFKEVP